MAGTTVRLKWNQNGLYALRSEPGVQAKLNDVATGLAARAGSGYSWSSRQGARRPQGRWRAIVFPDSWSAVRDNAKNNTLIRALGGSRL